VASLANRFTEEKDLEGYLLLSLVIIGFWVVGFIVYLVSSNRQRDIAGEINHVNAMLDASESGNEPE
jgi:uncharacterized membrane protein SpoIIM required for sporulation